MLFVLADFSVIKPDFGLIFWTTVIFGIFWYFVGKKAFTPIAKALKTREDDIQSALDEAKKAKEEMASLKAENELLLIQAREEKSRIIKEAKETGNSMVNNAKEKAKSEAKKIVTSAQLEIESQKQTALSEIKSQVATMAIDISEKLLGRELSDKKNQEIFAAGLIEKINLN